MTDVGLQAVAKGCAQITSLNLYGCSQVTDVGLEAVAKGCAQITSLDLRYCDKVTEEGKASVRAALPDCEIKDWTQRRSTNKTSVDVIEVLRRLSCAFGAALGTDA